MISLLQEKIADQSTTEAYLDLVMKVSHVHNTNTPTHIHKYTHIHTVHMETSAKYKKLC